MQPRQSKGVFSRCSRCERLIEIVALRYKVWAVRFRHKIRKLVDGRSLASARKHTLRLLRMNRFSLDTTRVIETIDPARFEQIRGRYAVANPGADWPKYLDLDRWIEINIRRIREVER